MQLGLHDLLTKLHHNHSLIDDILRQHPEPRHRAPLLAKLYRTVLPTVPLHACVLQGTDQAFAWVLDEEGNHRPEWAEQLQRELQRPPGPKGRGPVTLDSQDVAIEDIRFRDRTHGWLGFGLPGDGEEEITIAVGTFLALCSRQLALYLQLEQAEHERRLCESDRDDLTWLANLGELASPVSHEMNNFLNATLLHVAVLGLQAPEALGHDLAEIRRQGTVMAGVVKQLQQYRRRHQPLPQSVDLNRVVREVVEELSRKPSEAGSGVPIRLRSTAAAEEPPTSGLLLTPVVLDLAPRLPPVVCFPADLKRLCLFLITNAAAASAGGGGTVAVETRAGEQFVVLRLTDTGPSLTSEQLSNFFEPGLPNREGTDSLELAACRNLVRRFQGTIQAQPGQGQGLTVVVELPFSQPG
jgi:signal transduction histidine kinase